MNLGHYPPFLPTSCTFHEAALAARGGNGCRMGEEDRVGAGQGRLLLWCWFAMPPLLLISPSEFQLLKHCSTHVLEATSMLTPITASAGCCHSRHRTWLSSATLCNSDKKNGCNNHFFSEQRITSEESEHSPPLQYKPNLSLCLCQLTLHNSVNLLSLSLLFSPSWNKFNSLKLFS